MKEGVFSFFESEIPRFGLRCCLFFSQNLTKKCLLLGSTNVHFTIHSERKQKRDHVTDTE